jgi:integrase
MANLPQELPSRRSGLKAGRLGSQTQTTQPPIRCPECGGERPWRDGLRHLKDGLTVQRWLCRACGYRFSQPMVELDTHDEPFETPHPRSGVFDAGVHGGDFPGDGPTYKPPLMGSEYVGSRKDAITGKNISTLRRCSGCRRVGAPLREGVKNSAQAVACLEEKAIAGKWAAGATPILEEVKEKLIEYAWHGKKRGLAESTIKQRVYRLKRLVKHGADLYDPDSVSTVLAKAEWSPADKQIMVNAYKSFVRFAGLSWEPPRIQAPQKLPFIPTEKEIDELIAGCGRKTATFLQVLKDTGARGIEAARLKWIDVDLDSRAIRINHPVKGSLPRIVKVSAKTIAMINALPRTSEYIFNQNIHTIRQNFQKQRNKIAKKLQNPRIRQIHLHTFRHWFATTQYHKSRDILYVKHLLGHKQIKNTEVYTHLIDFENDEFHVACARTLEEEKKLIEAGFELVRYSEKDEVAIYRKRK